MGRLAAATRPGRPRPGPAGPGRAGPPRPPRGGWRPPQPAAGGPVLRILTASLLVGRAATGPVVDLVRSTGADVLFLQELTNDAAARLRQAGLGDLLPS